MNGGCLRALGRAPRNWAVERPVQLKDARSIAITTQFASVARRETVTGNLQELTRGYIQQHATRRREIVKRCNAHTRHNFAAKRFQMRSQGVRDVLRTAARNGPAAVVAKRQQHQSECGRTKLIERQTGM